MTSTASFHESQSAETRPTSRKKIKISDYRETANSEKLAVFDAKLKEPKNAGLFHPEMMDNTTFAGHYETIPADVGQKRKRESGSDIVPSPPASDVLEDVSSSTAPPTPRSTIVSRWDPSEKVFPPPAPARAMPPNFLAQSLLADNLLISQSTLLPQKKPISVEQKQDLTITPEEKVLRNRVDKERHVANIKAANITARQRELTDQLEALKATPIKPVDDVVRDLLNNPLLEGIDYHDRPKPQMRPFNKPTHLRQPRKDESQSERVYNEQQRTRRWHDVINGRCSVKDQETRFEFASTYSSLSMTELSDECCVRGLSLHLHAQQDGGYLVEVLQLNDHEFRKSLRNWKNASKHELLKYDQKSSEPIAGGDVLPKDVLANAMAKRDARLAVVRYNLGMDGRLSRSEPQWSIPSPASDTVPAVSAPERKHCTPVVSPSPPRRLRPQTPARNKVMANIAKATPPSASNQKLINEDIIAKAKAKAAQITASSSMSTKAHTNGSSKSLTPRVERHGDPRLSDVTAISQPEGRKRKRNSLERDGENIVLHFTADEVEEGGGDLAMDISDEDDDAYKDEQPLKKLNATHASAA